MVSPPFVEQSLWPATSLSAVLALLAVEHLSRKGMPFQLLYLGAGIVIFGCLQRFYFLVPLAFAGVFLSADSNKIKSKLLLQHLSWWVCGAIIGVLLMSILLFVTTHHFGVQIASWRRIRPIQDFSSLIRNIVYVANSFSSVLKILIKLSVNNVAWIAGLLLIVFTLGVRGLRDTWALLIILFAVLFSFFAFSLPLAPVIQMRSLEAMVTALVLLLVLLSGDSRVGNVLVAAALSIICANLSSNASLYLTKHKSDTEFVRNKLLQVIPDPLGKYQSIAIYGTLDSKNSLSYIFNSAPRMLPILNSLNVKGFHDCRSGLDRYCEKIASPEEVLKIAFAEGVLTFSISYGNIGVVQYIKN